MPSLVFPAPGSPYATRLPTTFSGFDIAPVTKTTIRNLLLDSQTFIGANWGVGPYTIPFNAINDYIDDGLLQSNVTVQLSGDAWLVTARSNTQRVGQQIAVLPNTTYTFSFFARRGTATDNRYKILDFSRNTDLVGPTSYYSQINNSTLTRITVTFTTSLNTRILVLYPVWDILSGYGNSYIANAQFELGTTASAYQATFGTANSAAGITVNRVVQLINKLPTFTSPASRHTVSKLSSTRQLKSTTGLQVAAKLSTASQLRDSTARLNTDQINRAKYSAALQEVLQITSNLNTFDNVGLVEGTVYSVTGVASGVSTNTVLDYIYDLDKITVTSSPVSQLIVYFNNPEMRYVFGIGSYVTLSDNASVKYTTQVLDRSPATVTVAKPTNWNNTELFSTITSASISVYPQIYVVPTLTPTNSRERLAQSQLVPIRGSSSLNSTYSIPLQDAYFFDYTGLGQSLNLGNISSPTFRLTSTALLKFGTTVSNAKLKDTNSILTQSNIKLDIFKLKDVISDKFNINFIDPAKFKNNVIFTAPAVDKLASAAVLREPLFDADINNLRSVSILRPITTNIENNYIEKLKLPADRTSVFDTPVSNKLTANANLKGLSYRIRTDKLVSNAKLKDTNSILTQSNIKLDIFKLTGDVNLRTDFTDRLKVRNTQVFSAPVSNNLNLQLYKLTSTATPLTTNKLVSNAKLKDTNSILTQSNIKLDIFKLTGDVNLRTDFTDRLKVRNTQVFSAPVSNNLNLQLYKLTSTATPLTTNKLVSNAVLRAAMPIIKLASFKISAIPVRSVADNLNTNSLTKPVTSIKEANGVFNYYNIDNTFYQSDVRTNQRPTNAREILFYANMAPGSRTNNSIQQGHVFSPDGSKLSTDQLEVFDNVKFASEPFYDVTSQANGTTANSVLEYIYDLDIITVSTSPINTLQLSFDNTDRVFNVPYPVGSYVALTRLNYPMYFAQVIDSSFNTVTISLPDDWSIDWSATQIGSASPTVFPKVNVRPAGYPTNSRELLFYAEMSPGYLVNRSIQYGNVFDQLTDTEIKNPTFLERDAWRVRAVYKPSLLSFESILNSITTVKGLQIEVSLRNQPKILPRTDIREILQGPSRGLLEPVIGTRFAEDVTVDLIGGIIRLKVGKFNKMHDVAVKKKDPIQFWN